MSTKQNILNELNDNIQWAMKCVPAHEVQLTRMDFSAVHSFLTSAIQLTQRLETMTHERATTTDTTTAAGIDIGQITESPRVPP